MLKIKNRIYYILLVLSLLGTFLVGIQTSPGLSAPIPPGPIPPSQFRVEFQKIVVHDDYEYCKPGFDIRVDWWYGYYSYGSWKTIHSSYDVITFDKDFEGTKWVGSYGPEYNTQVASQYLIYWRLHQNGAGITGSDPAQWQWCNFGSADTITFSPPTSTYSTTGDIIIWFNNDWTTGYFKIRTCSGSLPSCVFF